MADKVITFLDSAAEKIVTFFKNDVSPILADGVTIAKDVEPLVDMAFPGIGLLFNATVSMVGTVQATGATAAAGANTDTQKLAAVTAGLEPIMAAYFQSQYGVTLNTPQVQAWINAIVAALEALPAPNTATTSATVGTSTVTVTKAA